MEINTAWLRRLVATLSGQQSGLDHVPVHERFVVDKVASGQEFPSKPASPCQCYSTNSLYTWSSTRYPYQKGKERERERERQTERDRKTEREIKNRKMQSSFENRAALRRKVLLHLLPGRQPVYIAGITQNTHT